MLIERRRKPKGIVPLPSMADIAFILLVFFILTSTIDIERNIPVANLGTGYFAPESEKELTSRQNIARHALWLAHLVQAIAR